MTNWITLSHEILYDYLQANQVELLQTEALAYEQEDPVATVIAAVVERMRAEIRAHAGNRLSQTPGSLPPELVSVAAALCIETAQTRLTALELTADQVRAASNARRFMERVSRGEIPVTVPTDPIPVAESAPAHAAHVQLLGSRATPLTGDALKGL